MQSSLENLDHMLNALGRRDDALNAAEKAVALQRELAAERPDAYRPDLASSLNSLAGMLTSLGRREDALKAANEVVGLYRELAAAKPEDRKSTRLNSSHLGISYAVFCLKKKNNNNKHT